MAFATGVASPLIIGLDDEEKNPATRSSEADSTKATFY